MTHRLENACALLIAVDQNREPAAALPAVAREVQPGAEKKGEWPRSHSPLLLLLFSRINGGDCRCGAQRGPVWRRRPGVRPVLALNCRVARRRGDERPADAGRHQGPPSAP